METPDIGEALRAARARGLKVFAEDCSFFIGQHVVLPRPIPGWRGMRRRLFAKMQKRSAQAAEFFRMPGRGVVILTSGADGGPLYRDVAEIMDPGSSVSAYLVSQQ
jgi:K+ transporter